MMHSTCEAILLAKLFYMGGDCRRFHEKRAVNAQSVELGCLSGFIYNLSDLCGCSRSRWGDHICLSTWLLRSGCRITGTSSVREFVLRAVHRHAGDML